MARRYTNVENLPLRRVKSGKSVSEITAHFGQSDGTVSYCESIWRLVAMSCESFIEINFPLFLSFWRTTDARLPLAGRRERIFVFL